MSMKKTVIPALIAIVAVALVFAYRAAQEREESVTRSEAAQTISDGTLVFSYPEDFGLAVMREQILVRSYIPPCDEDFDYCFYYRGDAYEETNFESAGIRIKKRADLASSTAECLDTQPAGYAGLVPQKREQSGYATSVFAPVGGGAAGHYATGALYRLAYQGACYEFETRVGESQFANFPEGSVEEFTTAERDLLRARLERILENFALPSGERLDFRS